METKQSSQQPQDYIERMRQFIRYHCAARLACNKCRYMGPGGCSHPDHPANQKIPAFQPVKGEQA